MNETHPATQAPHASAAATPHGHEDATGAFPVEPEEFDHELNIRWILWTTAGLVAMTIAAVIVSWLGLKGMDVFDRHHPEMAAPPMEASREATPPGPLLQPSPSADMDVMRAQDAQAMDHAAWVDRAQGTVRLPIDVAMNLIAAQGLPKVATPPLSEMVAHGSYADDGRPPADQPSPGTLLPPPGVGISSIGPPSAGAGQQFGAAMPGPPVPLAGAAGAAGAAPPARKLPLPPPPKAGQPAAPTVIVPPPPPGGRP